MFLLIQRLNVYSSGPTSIYRRYYVGLTRYLRVTTGNPWILWQLSVA